MMEMNMNYKTGFPTAIWVQKKKGRGIDIKDIADSLKTSTTSLMKVKSYGMYIII